MFAPSPSRSGLSISELVRVTGLALSFLVSLRPPPPADLPGTPSRRSRGHAAFAALEGCSAVRPLAAHPSPLRLSTHGDRCPLPPGIAPSPRGVTRGSSVPCRSLTPSHDGWTGTASLPWCRLDPAPSSAGRFITGCPLIAARRFLLRAFGFHLAVDNTLRPPLAFRQCVDSAPALAASASVPVLGCADRHTAASGASPPAFGFGASCPAVCGTPARPA